MREGGSLDLLQYFRRKIKINYSFPCLWSQRAEFNNLLESAVFSREILHLHQG